MRARKRKETYRWLPFAAVMLVLISSFWAVDRTLRRAVSEKVQYRAEVLAMEMMSESVAEELADGETGTPAVQGPALLGTNGEGRVTAIEIDVRETARIQTGILRRLTAALSQKSRETITVPLGSLMSGEWFSEQGPEIAFTFAPEGAVRARTLSEFTAAGVNQTCHRVVLCLEMTVGAVTSFGSISVTVPGEFILAETVIVGEVPDSYTQVITEDQALIRDLNDYQE